MLAKATKGRYAILRRGGEKRERERLKEIPLEGSRQRVGHGHREGHPCIRTHPRATKGCAHSLAVTRIDGRCHHFLKRKRGL